MIVYMKKHQIVANTIILSQNSIKIHIGVGEELCSQYLSGVCSEENALNELKWLHTCTIFNLDYLNPYPNQNLPWQPTNI